MNAQGAPHNFIQEVETLGFNFIQLRPHLFFDRYIFCRGDMEVHIRFNGHAFSVSAYFKKILQDQHLPFSLTKENLREWLNQRHLQTLECK